MQAIKKDRNQTIDVFKLIASFAVICIHYMFSGTLGEVVKAVSRFAVPFFFAVSGYFAYRNDAARLKGKIRHILLLFLSSFLLYFVYSLFKNFLEGKTINEYLSLYIDNIPSFLILNTTVSSVHLWFLPALIYCYLIRWFVKERVPERIQFTAIFILMFAYLVIEEILPIFNIEISNFVYANVFFRAYPCFALGMFIRKHKRIITTKISFALIFAVFMFGLIETVVSVLLLGNSITYFGSMLIVASMMMGAVSLECKQYPDWIVKHSGMSMNVYIFHVAIGGTLQTILNRVGYGTSLLWINMKPFVVFVLCIILSYLIDFFVRLRKSRS